MPGSPLAQRLGLDLRRETTLLDTLKRPDIDAEQIAKAMSVEEITERRAMRQVEIETKYAGYIKRQDEEIDKIRRHESIAIPSSIDFLTLQGLSNELRQKLDHQRPATLARAASIPGMTPAALSILLVHAKSAAAR